MKIISKFLDFIYPPRCVFCRTLLRDNEEEICAQCRKDMPYAKGAQSRKSGEFFKVCISPLFYKDNVRESLLRYKFGGAFYYDKCYGKILADSIRQELAGKYDVITWVPLSRVRRSERTYDQARLLAKAAAEELGQVLIKLLVKPNHNKAQSGIKSRAARQANVIGLYKIKNAEMTRGKKILLIDDIITTGATLSECARVLLMAGAESVVCATLAQTENQKKGNEAECFSEEI